MAINKKVNGIVPEVMADMIDGKVKAKLAFTPYVGVDTTLQGQPGDTVTVPAWTYIGDAEDLAEAAIADRAELGFTKKTFTIKKISKQVQMTDEMLNSDYGKPLGQATYQIGLAISHKLDNDIYEALCTGSLKAPTSEISYASIVDANALFGEEATSEKICWIHPDLLPSLLKDPLFIDVNTYAGSTVTVTGEVGKISNTRFITSNKVKKDGADYVCPIVKVDTGDATVEDNAPAVTVFMKQGVIVENDRDLTNYTNIVAASEHYGAALTNDQKVVVAKFTPVAG